MDPMHRRLLPLLLAVLLAELAASPSVRAPLPAVAPPETGPSDLFYLQRAMPDGTIPGERYAAAFEEVQFERALAAQSLTAGTTSAQDWSPVSPHNIGGRGNAVVAEIGRA